MRFFVVSIITRHSRIPNMMESCERVHLFQSENNASIYVANRIFKSLNEESCVLEIKDKNPNYYFLWNIKYDSDILSIKCIIDSHLIEKNENSIKTMYHIQR